MKKLKCWHGVCAAAGVAWALAGCGAARPMQQQPLQEAALDHLLAEVARQFSDARPFMALPRALELPESGQSAIGVADRALEAWCTGSGGVKYGPMWPRETPNRVNDHTAAVGLMYSAAAAVATSDFRLSTCVLGGRSYTLASGAGAGRRRVMAWFGPDDVAEFIPAARTALAEARRQRKAEEERRLQDSRIRFLVESPIGTQLSCVQDQVGDQAPSDLIYRCGSYMVAFGDLAKFGWRITSQNIASHDSSAVVKVSRVTLLVEKIR